MSVIDIKIYDDVGPQNDIVDKFQSKFFPYDVYKISIKGAKNMYRRFFQDNISKIIPIW